MLKPEEVIRRYISLLTGKDFLPLNPDCYPHSGIRWLMYATFGRGVAATPYIHKIWAELDEATTLHMESEPLGDTLHVTEWTTGDPFMFDRGRFELSGFERMADRSKYAAKLPRVVQRPNSYEKFALKQAAKLGVNMQLLVHSSRGTASFHLDARFETIGMSIPILLHHMDMNVAALRKAFFEIEERQQSLHFSWTMRSRDNKRN